MTYPKTYFYNSGALSHGAVINITGVRYENLLNAVKETMNEYYGKKIRYCDGVTRYPWERKPYEQIIESLEKLPENSETVNYFGGFYEIVKNSLKRLAYKNAVCAEMAWELEQAEKNPQPCPEY